MNATNKTGSRTTNQVGRMSARSAATQMRNPIPGARHGRPAATARHFLRGDPCKAADAPDQGLEGEAGMLGGVRARGLAPEAVANFSPAQDPRIPCNGLLRPAQGHRLGPPAGTPHEAPALVLRPPALEHPGAHERAVRLSRPAPGGPNAARMVAVACQGRGTTPRRALCPVHGYRLQPPEIGEDLGPERVEVAGADQFEQVGLFFHHDGLVAVLEEVPDAPVAPIERPGVPRAERPHPPAQGAAARPDPQVGVVCQEGPGVDREAGRRPPRRQAATEVRSVGVILEDASARIPRIIKWWSTPGASRRAWRGVIRAG